MDTTKHCEFGDCSNPATVNVRDRSIGRRFCVAHARFGVEYLEIKTPHPFPADCRHLLRAETDYGQEYCAECGAYL